MKHNIEPIGAPEAAKILKVPLTTLCGMAERGEIPTVGTHRAGEPYRFNPIEIVGIAAQNRGRRRRKASDGTHRGRRSTALPGETVRAFGRATEEEVELWKEVAPNGQVWPWLRAMANKASGFTP